MTKHNKKSRQAYQQARKAKQRKSRVKLPKIVPMPDASIAAEHAPPYTTLHTRKEKGKRTLAPTRAKPTGFTSNTRTTTREGEQSLRFASLSPLRHSTQPRSLLLCSERQKRAPNLEKRFAPFLDTHARLDKISSTPSKRIRLMVTYPHSGWSLIDLENNVPLRTGLRERK